MHVAPEEVVTRLCRGCESHRLSVVRTGPLLARAEAAADGFALGPRGAYVQPAAVPPAHAVIMSIAPTGSVSRRTRVAMCMAQFWPIAPRTSGAAAMRGRSRAWDPRGRGRA